MAKTRITKTEACDVLRELAIPAGEDFHALRSSIVEGLVSAAAHFGYRKPKNANGSRGRYFYAYLQKACKR